jgi:uncharacterized Ntn-hydrolase superfamily protein
MTWSVVARDPASGAFGVAVTTKAFATGQRCAHARSRVGAVATQSFTNPTFGTRGLRLLAEGVPAADVVKLLIQSDPGRAIRQLHLVDPAGRTAAFTGASCVGWAGHKEGNGFSVAGNMLAGEAVVGETFRAFAAAEAMPFPLRFVVALDAGQAAGGDKRGRQSAVMLIYGEEEVADLDLRVDDHPEPLTELRRLYSIYERDIAPFRHVFPTRANPAGIHDLAEIEAIWAKGGRALSFKR